MPRFNEPRNRSANVVSSPDMPNGARSLLHFFLDGPRCMPTRDDINGAVFQPHDGSLDVLLRAQRWIQLAIGIERSQGVIGQRN